MKSNRLLYMICGIVAVVLVGVLLVGLIRGGQTGKYFGDYKGNGAGGKTEQTTDATGENTKGTEPDNTDATGGTNNNGGNSQGGNGAGIEDTDIKIPIGAITGTGNNISGNTGTGNTEGTENTEPTESTGSSGKIPGQVISFDDLVGKSGN